MCSKCSLCDTETPKYKCPNCRIPYCSVKCWRVHRDEHCEKIKEEVPTIPTQKSRLECYSFPTQDTVPLDQLELLGQSEGVRDTLRNPHVRNILDQLDKSNDPTSLLKDAMREPIFVQFVEECMKVIQPDEKHSSDTE